MNRHVTGARAGFLSPAAPAARRGDQGLTTLEWLLITAAVAALAALAVVLVSGYVEDTGARMSSPNPRITAAQTLAFTVEQDATAAGDGDFDTWSEWESYFARRCAQIEILYADAEARIVDNHFERALGGIDFDATAAGHAAAGDASAPTNNKAQVQCSVQ